MHQSTEPTATILLNQDWLFHEDDDNEAYYMGYDDRAWRRVTLPHDWAVEHPFDQKFASGTGYLPGGTGWYRKHFTLPQAETQKRVILCFDGVCRHARVWVNSNYLGENAYGYAPFRFDISDFVRAGENVIALRAEHNEVADSRWYTGSGIYRDVTLQFRDKRGLREYGVFLSTQQVRADHTAVLRLDYQTYEADSVCVRLFHGQQEAAFARFQGREGSGLFEVPDAVLWSDAEPFLYDVRIEAYQNGAFCDLQTLRFGIRTIRFDPDTGFYLNEKHTLIKGVCIHHDAGALGAAVPSQVWRRRLETLKHAGCNAIRTAHNPPSAVLLDLCDQLGLIVMDEAFDEWEGCKNKWWQGHNVYPPKHYGYATDFPQWHAHDLRAMVLRDRNHPCVVLWSIGNEIDYPNDPYVTPLFDEVFGNNDSGKPERARRYDRQKPDAGRLASVARELVAIVHELDTTRQVLSAMSFPELSTHTGFSDPLDLFGYNYRENYYDDDHARFPLTPILGSENGHAPSAWQAVLERPFIAGQFLWTGIDFLGECRGWPVRISQAGLLDLCGFPKPLYFQRKALWTTEPFVKIAVCKGTEADSIPWTDSFLYDAPVGDSVCVSVYTNAPCATLFLNGRSLGEKSRKPADECRLLWSFPFEPGVLTAKAGLVSDILATPGQITALDLSIYESDESSDDNVVQVVLSLKDGNGTVCANDDREFRCQLRGNGSLLGIENGKPDDLTPYSADYRTTNFGKAIIYIRKGSSDASVQLYVAAEGGLSACIDI